ncbi:hypothetical protein [Rhizobium sp. BK377]|uniref:hypothetical protein n=1 Tax=Rhizobium sp. BK377 TaxID=2587058 RepID=UPI0016081C18|nr:hypothetical protein [Rhizobium sp. BK377]MBB3460630.1 hypothetical protein [Rhizobium sp. BK377]
MKRAWPAEFNSVFDTAEEVTIEPITVEPINGERLVAHDEPPAPRKALRVRIPMETYERIWPLAEMRFRPAEGPYAGKAVTLIATNPHYHPWHPADGGSEEKVSDSGRHYKIDYLIVHFLLDDVRESVAA